MIEKAKKILEENLPLKDLQDARDKIGNWFTDFVSDPKILRWMVDRAFESELLKDPADPEVLRFLDVAAARTGMEYSIIEEEDSVFVVPSGMINSNKPTGKLIQSAPILDINELDTLSSLRYPKQFPRPEIELDLG